MLVFSLVVYKIEGFREVIFGCFWVFFEVVLEVFEGFFGGGFLWFWCFGGWFLVAGCKWY